MANLVQLSADGEVGIAGRPMTVHSVVLTPAAAASTAELRDGGVAGLVRLTLTAVANGESVSWTSAGAGGVLFALGCYVNLTGAGALVSVEASTT